MGEARDFVLVTTPASLPTGTVTFLLTDVEASAAGWQRAPEQMVAAVARYDALLDAAIAAHGGVRPVEQGDGESTVAAFERPSDAVVAGPRGPTGACRPNHGPTAPRYGYGWPCTPGRSWLRGEANYAGTTLHRCARLRDCAHGGQMIVSRATAELVLDRLPDGTGLVDLGPHQLTDLVRPEHVYQLTHPDLSREFPPLRSLDAHRHNLPHQTTPLIGRATELAAIASALDADRLVTLTGAAGIGKTRLAVHAAADRIARHPDGVAFVELATVNDPAAVASKVAGVLRVWESTTEPTLDAITRFVADRMLLIVLDNCEHVIDAAADLAVRLLEACPHVTILATSREPLGVPGEVAWRVPSLPTPAIGQPLDLVELSDVRLGAAVRGPGPAGPPRFHPHRSQRPRRGRDLQPARRHPARPRARRRPLPGHDAAEDRRRARPPVPAAHRRGPHGAGPPADPAGLDRVEPRPARAGRAGRLPPPQCVHRAVPAGGRRGRLRGRRGLGLGRVRRHDPAGRQVRRRARPRDGLVPAAGNDPPLRRRPLQSTPAS